MQYTKQTSGQEVRHLPKHKTEFDWSGGLYGLISLGAAIALWLVISHTKAHVIFATPAEVWKAFQAGFSSGKLPLHIWASVRRSLTGFILAFFCSLPVAFAMGWYRPVRLLLEHWVKFVKSIPPISYITLIIVAMGVGETAKVTVIFIGSFLVMVINIYQGVRNVDNTLIKAAHVLGAGDIAIFFKVVIPASLPYVMVAARLGLASSLTTLVAAELTGAQMGLGQMIQEASMYFKMDVVLMGILIIGIVGTLLDRTICLLERRLTAWQEIRNI